MAHVGREGRDPTWETDSGQREGGGGSRVVGAAPGRSSSRKGLKMLPPAPTPEPTEPSCLSDHLFLTASPSSGQTSSS